MLIKILILLWVQLYKCHLFGGIEYVDAKAEISELQQSQMITAAICLQSAFREETLILPTSSSVPPLWDWDWCTLNALLLEPLWREWAQHPGFGLFPLCLLSSSPILILMWSFIVSRSFLLSTCLLFTYPRLMFVLFCFCLVQFGVNNCVWYSVSIIKTLL